MGSNPIGGSAISKQDLVRGQFSAKKMEFYESEMKSSFAISSARAATILEPQSACSAASEQVTFDSINCAGYKQITKMRHAEPNSTDLIRVHNLREAYLSKKMAYLTARNNAGRKCKRHLTLAKVSRLMYLYTILLNSASLFYIWIFRWLNWSIYGRITARNRVIHFARYWRHACRYLFFLLLILFSCVI